MTWRSLRIERERLLTSDKVRELLAYDASTGLFTWLVDPEKGPKTKGRVAGTSRNGYRLIKIGQVKYFAHRLAWLITYGQWPEADIDHINGDGSDNRICNLREATHSQNLFNQGRAKSNKSGVKGVFLDQGAWKAKIRARNEVFNLGSFASKELAQAAYARAARELHGEFARV